MHPVLRNILAGGLVVAATFVAYIPSIRGDFIWDDDQYVTRNEALEDLHGLWRIWTVPRTEPQYYPLTHTTFWLEYHAWGLWPMGYKLVNVSLHAASAVLLWIILARLGLGRAAMWAGALFALHPMHVESVAWITERKNVLCGFFYMLSAMTYLQFARHGQTEARRRWGMYAAALALFGCALLSKTVAATLPAALLLVLWWKSGRIPWRDAAYLAPMFIAGAVMGRMTAFMEVDYVGARGPDWEWTVAQRLAIAGRAVWFYAGKFLWPFPLAFFYEKWSINPVGWRQLLPAGAVAAALLGLWLGRRRIGRGPLVAGAFFVLSLLPALGFANVFPMRYSFVANHFAYLASIGLLTLAAVVIRKLPRPAAVGLLAAIAAALGVRTWIEGGVYRDAETLWRETIRVSPRAWLPHHNLAVMLADRWEVDQAERHFRTAARVAPETPKPLVGLGGVLVRTGRIDEAIEVLDRAIDRSIARRDFEYDPYANLAYTYKADALAALNRMNEARALYEKSLSLRPDDRKTRMSYARAVAAAGETDAAMAMYEDALKRWPDDADLLVDTANLLLRRGMPAEAMRLLTRAVRTDPNSARAQDALGRAWAATGQPAPAEVAFRRAIAIAPRFPEAHYNLGFHFESLGRIEEAAACYRRALVCRPGFRAAADALRRVSGGDRD